MTRARRLVLGAALAGAMALGGLAAWGQGAAPAKVYSLSYGSPYPPTHPFSRADIAWIKYVEARSNGRLKITPYWGGTLIGSDTAVSEIRHGVADAGLITPIYMRGGVEAIKLQAGFYGGARTPEEQTAVYRCLIRDFPVLSEELSGLRVLALQGGNLPNVITRDRQVRKLSDLRGLRLRTPAELSPLLRKLGAEPVTMPMGDVYSALSKGVIDGVVAPADTIKSLHFSEVARYINTLEVSRGAYQSRAISDRAWRRLPPDLQALLTGAQGYWEEQLSKEVTSAEQAGVKFGQETGIKTITFDPAEQARFDQLYNQVSLETAAKTAPAYGAAMFHRAQAAVAQIRAGKGAC